MKIKSLSYHNKELNWQLERTEFGNLNLLVGASGVGKTRTLEAILDLQRIAQGKALGGVAWDVKFSVDGEDYRWWGEFERRGEDANFSHIFSRQELEQDNENKAKILYEHLSSSHDKIVEREGSDIKFQGQRVPVKLSIFESAMSLFNEDEVVAPIHSAFSQRIVLSDLYKIDSGFIFKHKIIENLNIKKIRNGNLKIIVKLAIAHQNALDVFEQIKSDFIDIFPNVEDVIVTEHLVRDIPAELKEMNIENIYEVNLSIKEVGVKNLIHSDFLSAGMLKTFLFIAEMYLAAEGTVILIDEFENGLGINCIDVLNDFLLEDRGLQYIMTSHHPYIINNVPMDYWKIVTRKGSLVKVRRAEEFELGKSKHEAFMQLMQLEEFTEGITLE